MMKYLSPLQHLVLPMLFLILGPMMAEAPRLLTIWLGVAFAACLPICIAHFNTVRHSVQHKTPIILLIALGFSCLSVLWSPSARADDMAWGLVLAILGGAAVLLAAELIDARAQKRIETCFMIGWAIGLVVLVGELAFGHPLFRMVNHPGSGEMLTEAVTKRGVALYALSIWPFAFALSHKKPWLGKAAVIAFFLLAAFLTSRSALFAMFVGLVVLFFAHYQVALTRWVLMVVVVFGLLFTPVLATMLPLAPQEFTGRFFDSAQHRMKIWAITARHVADHPIFGNGLDASRGIESTVRDEAASYMPAGTSVISQHPHNVFLQIWLDLGLVGALLWGWLLLWMADRTRFLPAELQPYALAACYAAICMLNTTYSILQAWWSAGHVAVAALLLCLAYNKSRSAATSGTSAGGIS